MSSLQHSSSHPTSGSSTTTSSNIQSTAIPHSPFDSFSTDTHINLPHKYSHSSSSSLQLPDEDKQKEDITKMGSASSSEDSEDAVYNEKDHRRLLFGLTREGMTPQVELVLRLIDEVDGLVISGEGSETGSVAGGDDEEEEQSEVEDLDAVGDEGDFERGHEVDPINSQSPEGKFAVSPPPSPDPYAVYRSVSGEGRVREWLDGLQTGEMVDLSTTLPATPPLDDDDDANDSDSPLDTFPNISPRLGSSPPHNYAKFRGARVPLDAC